ncbi:MAG: amidohydrolase family protein [Boseongicola sp.]|nr:amidohydrolase family protein [Boseongicola sp.]
MIVQHLADVVLPNARVPVSMIARLDMFGGARDQDCVHGDLLFRNGYAERLLPAGSTSGTPWMVLPKLTECHVHLDKCYTVSRMSGVRGGLQAAIAAQDADRVHWTESDVRSRAMLGLEELISSGCGSVRSHVDWGRDDRPNAPSLAWSVLGELAQECSDRVTLQLAPLTDAEQISDPAVADDIAREIASKDGAFGVFVFDQANRRKGIRQAFEAADRHGLALDFHVDEGLDDELDGLEIIADLAIETGFQGPVLCGHACHLMNLDPESLKKLTDKLLHSNISVASLPATNLFLQGRAAGTPDRRGVTRIHELCAAGVPVVVGTDNVQDAFCPLGRHDPRQSLALAVLAAHLDPPFGSHFPMITTSARKALGLSANHVDGAAIGDLIMFGAASTSDMLAGVSPPERISAAFQGELA